MARDLALKDVVIATPWRKLGDFMVCFPAIIYVLKRYCPVCEWLPLGALATFWRPLTCKEQSTFALVLEMVSAN